MRLPSSTPNSQVDFSNEADAKEFVRQISSPELMDFARKANDRYFHWDEVRFRDQFEEFVPSNAWRVIKWTRRQQYQPLPLKAIGNLLFNFWVPPQHQEWLHRLDQDAGGMIGAVSDDAISENKEKYLINSLMEEAIASSQLEGASTTRAIAKSMLQSKREPKNGSEMMIHNNYKAIQEIQTLKEQPLTPKMLTHLQEIITAGCLDHDAEGGRFRIPEDGEVVVIDNKTGEVMFQPCDSKEVDARIKQLCLFANEKSDKFIHPIIKAIILHFMIGYIHPFADGNGRTARAVFYWYMLSQGYWLFEYLPISRMFLKSPIQYGRAYLYTEHDENDLTYFTHYHLKKINEAVDDLIGHLKDEQALKRKASAALKGRSNINHRQLMMMMEFLKDSHLRTTVHQYAAMYRVARGTATADLTQLVDEGLLRKTKNGRAFIFSAAHGLRKSLLQEADETVSNSTDHPDGIKPLKNQKTLGFED